MQKMPTNLFTTLDEAKQWVKDHSPDGCICPCCKRVSKIYKRNLNSVMARCLIRLYWLDKRAPGFHHVKDIVVGISDTGTNDFPKLKYWGLAVEGDKDDNNTKTRTSGFWKITEKGKLFANNKLSVFDAVYLH